MHHVLESGVLKLCTDNNPVFPLIEVIIESYIIEVLVHVVIGAGSLQTGNHSMHHSDT